MWVLSLAITGVRPGNGLGLGWKASDNQGSQCNCRVQICMRLLKDRALLAYYCIDDQQYEMNSTSSRLYEYVNNI